MSGIHLCSEDTGEMYLAGRLSRSSFPAQLGRFALFPIFSIRRLVRFFGFEVGNYKHIK